MRQRLRSCWRNSPATTPQIRRLAPPPPPEGDSRQPWYLDGTRRQAREATPLARLVDAWVWSDAAQQCLYRHLREPGCLLIASEAAGIGKTRLLQAMLAALDDRWRPVYLRGRWEPFRFLDDHARDGTTALLVANEISPHLDTYLWGEAARRSLDLARAGWPLWATAHAVDAEAVRDLVAGFGSGPVTASLGLDVLTLTAESGQVLCDAIRVTC